MAVHFAPVQPFGRALRARALLAPAAEMVSPHLQRAAAEARRLGLSVQIGAATAEGPELFGGIGDVEPPAADAEQVVEEQP